jgi:hypothetical protein
MVAKKVIPKKTVPKKKAPSAADFRKKEEAGKKKSADISYDVSTPNGRTAYEIAKQAGGQYMNSPYNRTSVSNPMNYPVGSDSYYTKTGGRFRVADKIMTKAYKETKTMLDKKYPGLAKPIKPSVTKASKKK